MPPYELVLIYRTAPKAEMKEFIKRTLSIVKNHQGIVGKMEHIGERDLPLRMLAHNNRYKRGFYMFMQSDIPAKQVMPLRGVLKQDHGIIRSNVIRLEEEMPRPCATGECFFGELNNTEYDLAVQTGRFKKLDA